MALISYASRSFLKVTGADKAKFLQGLITNDIHRLKETPLLYTALLTPQGRYLFDFFVFEKDDAFFLIVEKEREGELLQRLMLYKLRSEVQLTSLGPEWSVYVCSEEEKGAEGQEEACFFSAPDPRHPALGTLLIRQEKGLSEKIQPEEAFIHKRYQFNIAEGSHELVVHKSIVLEYHFDELNAMDWTKGCYMGQELMARTKHRGGIHKVCVGFKAEGFEEGRDAELFLGGDKVGKVIAYHAPYGLSLIRCEHFEALKTQNWQVRTEKGCSVQLNSP